MLPVGPHVFGVGVARSRADDPPATDRGARRGLTRPVLFANIGGGRREERTIKTVLCYGDSNTWGSDPETGERLAPDVHWPGLLRRSLGEGYGHRGGARREDDGQERSHRGRPQERQGVASICSSKGVTPIVPAYYAAWRGPGAGTPLWVFRSVSYVDNFIGGRGSSPRLPRSYCCETSGLLEQLGSRTALTSGSSRFFWVTRVEPVSMSSNWASLRMASMAALVPS